MKKIFIILCLLVFIYSAYAFSLSDLFNINLNIVGKSVTNRDPGVTLSRPSDTQVVNNPVVFKWRYFDPEDDELLYYILQIDDDLRFYSPKNYKGIGTEQKLTLEGGYYYWRVQVVNKYGKSFSDIWEFYVDPQMKVCEDGAPYYECSTNKPYYCSAGDLKQDCRRCGCNFGGVCQVDGSCLILKCIDETIYGSCSTNKPYYCLNGKLTQVCNICGCEEGFECTGEGNCREIVEAKENEPAIVGTEKEFGFIEKVILFLKRLFS